MLRYRLLVFLICFAAVLAGGCADDQPESRDPFSESGPTVSGDEDPLLHALQLLELKEKDLRRPVPIEEDYHTLARLPLVDQLSGSPFFLQKWSENTSKNLQNAAGFGMAELFPVAAGTVNGGASYPPVSTGDRDAEPRLADALRYMFDRYQTPVDAAAIDQIDRAGMASAFERQLARLLIVMTDAAVLLDHAFANLSAEEAAYLAQRPERYFYPDGSIFNFLTAPTHTQRKILSLARKIDFPAMFTAATWVTAAVDDFTRNLPARQGPGGYLKEGISPQGLLLDIPTPLGRIILAGTGDDRHNRIGALTIDMGGNDIYRPPADSPKKPAGHLSVLIDLEGNDFHDAENNRAVQGFGNLSVALLVDRKGNDRYRAGDLAQGCGVFGVGLLADYDGNDHYEMGLIGQGFGVFGVGVLLDRRGQDRYAITGLGQGVGSTMGAGILCDAGGADKYLAKRSQIRGQLQPDDWSHAQGVGLSVRAPDWGTQASLYGGVGILSDGGGDDFYYSSHENCMGASYFLSLGILVDHDGNDWYLPGRGMGIGFAVHLGSAVFIDQSGDDRYYGNWLSGGAASDRSIAVMFDYRGNDEYGPNEEYAKTLVLKDARSAKQQLTEEELRKRIRMKLAQNSYASVRKPKSLGLLIDYSGNDRYTANPDEFGQSFGGLLPPVEPQDWGRAILFDLGGQDIYSHPDRSNNRYVKSMGHALCYDTESKTSLQGSRQLPSSLQAAVERHMPVLPTKDLQIRREVTLLSDPDTFVRFAARGRLVEKDDPAVIEELLDLVLVSEDDQLNHEILEVIKERILTGKMNDDPTGSLQRILNARDPRVRIFAAGALGRYRAQSALGALQHVAKDPEEAVRVQAIRAIGWISAGAAVDMLLEIGRSDPSSVCRREAWLVLSRWLAGVKSLSAELSDKMTSSMVTALEDGDEVVRTAAAGALACCTGNKPAREYLDRALTDESFYVRRAAARSLIAVGVKAGIPAMIETLQFPSIDTRQHYDHELAKELAYYCGIDFPEAIRYEYDTWKNWWDQNKEKVDLEQNLEIRRRIEAAFEKSDESEGIVIFENLRSRFPQNEVIRNRYVRYCSDWITFGLLTQKNVDRQVLRRCLRLQKILTQLQPDEARYWVSLAYFQYRLGNYRLALAGMESALQLDPDNESYLKKRDAYRMLLEEKGTNTQRKAS